MTLGSPIDAAWDGSWLDSAGWGPGDTVTAFDRAKAPSPIGVFEIPPARGIFDTPGTWSPHAWTPGEKWAGGATPMLGQYYPEPPVGLQPLPYVRTQVPADGESHNPTTRIPQSTMFRRQSAGNVALVAGSFVTVASLDLTNTGLLNGYEALLERARGRLATAVGGPNAQLLTWRISIDGLTTPEFPEWTGSWGDSGDGVYEWDEGDWFVRVPMTSVLRLECRAPAGFPADNAVKGFIRGQVWPCNRPGHTTAGDLRR